MNINQLVEQIRPYRSRPTETELRNEARMYKAIIGMVNEVQNPVIELINEDTTQVWNSVKVNRLHIKHSTGTARITLDDVSERILVPLLKQITR